MSNKPDDVVNISIHGLPQPTRRQTLQWVLASIAASSLPTRSRAQEVGRTVTPQENAAKQPNPTGHGYGTDPELLKIHTPGDFWPLTFTPDQKRTATALADTIIPKDDLGPSASDVGVVEMLDEWISAPYPEQKDDRDLVLPGLAWLEAESKKRFNTPFPKLADAQRHQICDDICHPATAKPEFKKQAEFFATFRDICAAAYYSTPQGWQAIGYVGNVALPQFDGPPAEVLEKLGVTQTVK
jgi:hypothetical protein